MKDHILSITLNSFLDSRLSSDRWRHYIFVSTIDFGVGDILDSEVRIVAIEKYVKCENTPENDTIFTFGRLSSRPLSLFTTSETHTLLATQPGLISSIFTGDKNICHIK